MGEEEQLVLRPVGRVGSPLRDRAAAPKQGDEGTPDRPNPIGLHRVTILAIDGTRMRVQHLEALDGTLVLDVKPVLGQVSER